MFKATDYSFDLFLCRLVFFLAFFHTHIFMSKKMMYSTNKFFANGGKGMNEYLLAVCNFFKTLNSNSRFFVWTAHNICNDIHISLKWLLCTDRGCPTGRLCAGGVCSTPCDVQYCPKERTCSGELCYFYCKSSAECGYQQECRLGLCSTSCIDVIINKFINRRKNWNSLKNRPAKFFKIV